MEVESMTRKSDRRRGGRNSCGVRKVHRANFVGRELCITDSRPRYGQVLGGMAPSRDDCVIKERGVIHKGASDYF